MITQGKAFIGMPFCKKRLGITKLDKRLPSLKQVKPLIMSLIPFVVTGMFLAPGCLFAGEVITTYDKKNIWYPSMFVGRIWVKSGGAPPANGGDEGQVLTGTRENSSSGLKADPRSNGAEVEKNPSVAIAKSAPAVKTESARSAEIKEKLKQKRLKTIQALARGKTKKTASDKSSSVQASNSGKQNQKTSGGKPVQPLKTASSKESGLVTPAARQSARSWHHKQELYDVECGQKLVRVVATYFFDKEETLLGANVSPDPQWYHIYPGSVEEKLYVELCRPSN